MAQIWTQTLLSIAAVSLVSLVGGLTLVLRSRFDLLLTGLTAFAAGGLLGNSFLHMLPEAVETHGFGVQTSATVLAGIVVFFLFEKLLLWRHEHGDGSHDHAHATKPYAFTAVFGDALHNFIDGAVIASACAAGSQLGMATTLAVVLHEVPQELGDFGVLVKGGVPPGRALVMNFLSALVAFAGGIVALLMEGQHASLIAMVVPFSAGGFIYVAAADLIPEMHREMSTGRSILQVLLLVAGMAMMALMLPGA